MKPGQNPKNGISVVIPNLNGAKGLVKCLDSLQAQTAKAHIIVVDNASTDGSLELLRSKYPAVEIISNRRNRGFAGGVNPGLRVALKRGDEYVACFNNDAVADKNWLEKLMRHLNDNPSVGIATSKMIDSGGKFLDSTGEFYTSWGLPYPRGRREQPLNKYDDQIHIFAASGGASLFRCSMLKQIGLFDEDFFAYYEDVDLSFRARLAGWDVEYVPSAIVHHEIGATSSRISGFTTRQTLRNLPLIIIKNLPYGLWPTVLPRFFIAYCGIFISAVMQGNGKHALLGLLRSWWLIPKKFWQRHSIQSRSQLNGSEVSLLLVRDLPPDALRLRKLRAIWWQVLGQKVFR